MEYDGAKVAVFLGERLLVIRRDARMDVSWAGGLDWPGGAREPGETPPDTAVREAFEEVGLTLDPSRFEQRNATTRLGVHVIKYAIREPQARAGEVVLGDEGQAWGLMTPEAYLESPDAIPSLAAYLRAELGYGWPKNSPRVPCRTPAKGRDGVTSVPVWKYALMRGWLRELARRAAAEGLRFQGLSDKVGSLLHDGDAVHLGSVGWHLTTVKLELEVRGELARHPGKGPQRIVPGPNFLSAVTGRVPE